MKKRKNDWLSPRAPLLTRRRIVGLALLAILLASGFHLLRNSFGGQPQTLALSANGGALSFEQAASKVLDQYPNAIITKLELEEDDPGENDALLWEVHIRDADGQNRHLYLDAYTGETVKLERTPKTSSAFIAPAISYQEAVNRALSAYGASFVSEVSYHDSATWHVHLQNSADNARAVVKVNAHNGDIVDIENKSAPRRP